MRLGLKLWLIRHGETEWSQTRRHTGRTDLPLTEAGREQAAALKERLASVSFADVYSSPLRRASETAILAGLGDRVVFDDDLSEWDYGIYEGRTTLEIQKEQPGWDIWATEVPRGESASDVGARTDRVIARAAVAEAAAPSAPNVAIFAHAHLLRILAARWLGLPANAGRYFTLSTASMSVLAYERRQRVIESWNDTSHLAT